MSLSARNTADGLERKIGQLFVQPTRNVITFGENSLALEPRIMDVLCVLAEQRGDVVSRTELIDRVWAVNFGGDESLSRAISQLRKALKSLGAEEPYIETIPKRGYRIVKEITWPSADPEKPLAVVSNLLPPVRLAEDGRPARGRTRIAVLPFATLNSDENRGYFADGIVDELITTLGQIPQLLVAGRTSSFHFRNTELDLPAIAEALNVGKLIEGSVQRQGNIVRIDVHLIDGATGFEMWSYSYDGTVDDIFTSREIVAKTVSRELGNALQLDVRAPAIRRMTPNQEAFGLYLQGSAMLRQAFGDGALSKAIHLLEQALELDPDFAECWSALAEAHVYTAVFTPCLDKLAETAKMAECARKAIALDQTQGHARAMLGLHSWTQNDAVGALDLAFEAYRLEPNNPAVVLRLGAFLLYCGLTREALPYVEDAINQDPVDGRSYGFLCVAHLNLGNIDAAIKAGQRMVDLGQPSLHLAAATAASGNHDLAVEQYMQTRALMNKTIFPPAGTEPLSAEAMDAYWLMAAKGIHSGSEESRAKFCQFLEKLHESFPDPYDPSIVWPAVWMGCAPVVFKTLGKQITPPNMVALMSLWADIEPIRQTRLHPDFMDFAERIGLVAAWEKYGWPDLFPRPPVLGRQ